MRYPLASVPFTEDHLVAVLPNEHPFAHKEAIYIKELHAEKMLLHPHGSRPYNKIVSMCKQESFEPNIIYTDSHMRTICAMVASKMGISLLMKNLVPIDISGICTVPIVPTVTSKISLCYRLDHELTEQQKNFLAFYRSEKKYKEG